jgi:hypothetical protein
METNAYFRIIAAGGEGRGFLFCWSFGATVKFKLEWFSEELGK